VPIPFLRATDISPIALLSENVFGGMQPDTGGTGTVEALQELFSGDGQSKKGRRGINEVTMCVCVFVHSSIIMHIRVLCALLIVTDIDLLTVMQQMPLPPSICQRLTSSSTLMNLAQALAYHKMYAPSVLHQFYFFQLCKLCWYF
jgi:serine/threonine-protein kinase 24/25/MST4